MLRLPRSLEIGDKTYKIDSDFRTAITILQTFEDPDLSDSDKRYIGLGLLFEDDLPEQAYPAATILMMWFLDGGDIAEGGGSTLGRLFSWDQDLRFILSATDKVLGFSSRSADYLHWWDFLSAFNEIDGNSVFATIVHQRRQKKLGRQTKEDREWWAENEHIAKLKEAESKEDKEAIERFEKLMNGD